jgi:hypothetical protein
MLAYMLQDPLVLQDADTERRMVEAMVAKGAVAAGMAASVPWVDGTSPAVQQAIVTILQEIVHNGLRSCGFGDFPVEDGVIAGRRS